MIEAPAGVVALAGASLFIQQQMAAFRVEPSAVW
ncbi:hypothetical protein JOD64_000676 [Micromonospora luteifusca]|uniref:Uncharacterized protein n=1 Tax=Micromonospora luteifusca TaxID=709860 RepID=A0ABS2LP65_9ACTN|nr:hypothetical protein [Micromonospora luteifusca]